MCECQKDIFSVDHHRYPMLFRAYVSRKALGNGRAILEGLGLHLATIRACYADHPQNEEEAVQSGLTKWVEGKGHQPPTWECLLQAMEYAQISQQSIEDLKEKLCTYAVL